MSSLYPRPVVLQDRPVEKENPSLGKEAASTPMKPTRTYGRLSQTPKAHGSSARPSAAVTPGLAQKRNISRAQLLMKQYADDKAKKSSLAAKKGSLAMQALATPARPSAAARPAKPAGVADVSRMLDSLTLVPTSSPSSSGQDGGYATPDDEFYDVPDDFDFKHDTPAKAHRRMQQQQSRRVDEDLQRAKARLALDDVHGAQKICDRLFETQQQSVFKSAAYYVLAASVSRKSNNVPKAISLLSSAVRVGATPKHVLQAAIQRFLDAADGRPVRDDLNALLARLDGCPSSSSDAVEQSDAAKMAEFRTRAHAAIDTPTAKPRSTDEQDVKMLTTLMASAIEKEKVIHRMTQQTPTKTATTTPAMTTTPSSVRPPLERPATCEPKSQLTKTRSMVSSPFFRANRPGRVLMPGASKLATPSVQRPVVAASSTTVDSATSSCRSLDFSSATPVQPAVVEPVVVEPVVVEPVVVEPVVVEPATPVVVEPVAAERADTDFFVRYEAPEIDSDDDEEEQAPVASSQSEARTTRGNEEKKSSGVSASETLLEWLGGSQQSPSSSDSAQAELGRFRTYALTQSRGRNGRKKTAKPDAEGREAAVPVLVPVQIDGQVALVAYGQSASASADPILTPVRRSVRLNPDAASKQRKPKVLQFCDNPF